MKVWRCSGFWMLLLAVIHLATTWIFYGDSVHSILEAGVLGAVDEDPGLAAVRGVAFWYITAGLALGLLGSVVMAAERRGDSVTRGLAWAVGAIGVWGVLLSPVSGFWLFLPIAWLTWHNTRGLTTKEPARRVASGPSRGSNAREAETSTDATPANHRSRPA